LRSKEALTLIIFFLIAEITIEALGENSTRYTYLLSYTLENRGDEPYLLKEVEATFPMLQNNSWQNVRIVQTTHPVAIKRVDVDGNRIAILDLPQKIDPHSSLIFSIKYDIESVDRSKTKIEPDEAGSFSDIPSELVEEFCVETETFTIGDEKVQALALRLSANETRTLGVVTRLLEWIIDNVSYRAFEVPRYPNETLSSREGDCDDQAILLVTMCRATGVPAILQTGCLFDDGIEKAMSSWSGHLHIEQKGIGWHGWALVYIPPWGWLPIDLTYISLKNPILRISNAPEHNNYIITGLNVSRQDYIREIYRRRELLISSKLYIRKSEISVRENSYFKFFEIYEQVTDIMGSLVVFIFSTFPVFFIIFETIIFFYCLLMLY